MAGDDTRVPERSEIEAKYRWATETIFPNKEAWEKEYAAVEKLTQELAEYKDTLKNGGENLLKVAQLRDDTEARLSKVYVYASLLADQDTRVGDTQAMRSRARSLAIGYNQATSWMEPELTSIPFEGYLSGEWINWHDPYEKHLPRELRTLRRYERDAGQA